MIFYGSARSDRNLPPYYTVQGFTIVEILVAIALLGILATVLTATLTGSLNLNRQSQRQLDTATRAQQVMESIRGAWVDTSASGGSVSSNYDRACVPSSRVTLNGLSAKYINLNSRGQPINAAGTVLSAPSATNVTIAVNCSTQAVNQMTSGAAYPMRRLIVSSSTGGQDITLTLDVLRPQ